MFEIRTLENGVKVIADPNPNVRSVSLGVWVASGTRQEPPELNGASHYIEHMLFKGTDSADAAALADHMDALGGEVNAFTTKECTCFYGRVLDEKLREFTDLLADMLFHSRFDEGCVETERGVIIEEIGMCDDTPDDLAVENLMLGVYRGTPLGYPILGTRESLAPITGKCLKNYMAGHYVGGAVVISICGHFTVGDLDYIAETFARFPAGERAPGGSSEYRPAMVCVEKQTEQNHIVIGFPALSYLDEDRFALQILNNIIGGNVSSRLFQRIREQLGLCYSVSSFLTTHSDCGMLAIYIGTGAKSERKAITEIGRELRRLLRDGIPEEELYKVRDSIRSGLLMGLESTSARMNYMGKGLLLQNCASDPDKAADRYLAVERDQIEALAQRLLREDGIAVSAVTRKGSAEKYAEWLREGFLG